MTATAIFETMEKKAIADRGGKAINYAPMRATYILFRDFLMYKKPLSYDEWNALPEDHKAAALFVQFYSQITLAMYKCKTNHATDEEAVETAIQYLMKNVPIIEAHPKKFSEAYIYRVMYNCLYCIYYDRLIDKNRLKYEVSNITYVDGDELDLFDTIVGGETIYAVSCRNYFWSLIESMDSDTRSVVSQLLGNPRSEYHKVPEAKKAEIIQELKRVLEPFKDLWYV